MANEEGSPEAVIALEDDEEAVDYEEPQDEPKDDPQAAAPEEDTKEPPEATMEVSLASVPIHTSLITIDCRICITSLEHPIQFHPRHPSVTGEMPLLCTNELRKPSKRQQMDAKPSLTSHQILPLHGAQRQRAVSTLMHSVVK